MIFHNATNVAPNGPTVLEFGHGDIIINTIKPSDGGDYPFGVSFLSTPEPTPPGTDRPEFDHLLLPAFQPQVVMTFTQAASFDAVITRLQLAKEAFIAQQSALKPTKTKRTRMVKIRSYEFQHGLLHLRIADTKGLTDEQVAEKYGQGKGALLEAWDDVMPLRQLNALDDFTEQ